MNSNEPLTYYEMIIDIVKKQNRLIAKVNEHERLILTLMFSNLVLLILVIFC